MKMNSKLVALLFMGAFIVSAGLSLGVSLNPQDSPGLTETEDPEVEDPEDTDDVDDGDEDDDDIDDDYEDEHGRVVKVENGTDEIKLESELKTGDRKDQFTVKIHAGDDLGIKLEYESESEIVATSEETELEIEFKVVFKSLIEFVDTDGDGLYNTSADEEIQVYRLNDFSPIVYDPQVQPDLSTLHYLNVSTTDGVFTAHIYIAGEFMDMETTILTPSQVKIDIEIQNFDYWDDNSQLALYTKLESDYEVEEEEETEDELYGFSPAASESSVQSEMNGFMAGFSWAEQADVDGFMKDVFVTSIDVDDFDSNDDKMYIIYPRGTRIYHDPKIGVLGIMDDPNGFAIPGYPLLALFAGSIAIISMLAIISKRKFK